MLGGIYVQTRTKGKEYKINPALTSLPSLLWDSPVSLRELESTQKKTSLQCCFLNPFPQERYQNFPLSSAISPVTSTVDKRRFLPPEGSQIKAKLLQGSRLEESNLEPLPPRGPAPPKGTQDKP
uniref:Uncharacterized protein n=1 Tax=Sphaerodactylus townsendi TaxID=933632 RepID=A0ACB8G6K5_9SAUR